MKSFVVNFALFVTFVFISTSNISAASLDEYYLSRFGGMEASQLIAAVQVETSGSLPPERCGTPLIRSLRQDWSRLQAATQVVLAKELAAPVLDSAYQSQHFTIHYTLTGADAVKNSAIVNASGIPVWVETVATTFENVYVTEIAQFGYKDPIPAGQRFDVYLKNIGSQYLGVTYSSLTSLSYITIENDFAEFPSYDPTALLQVTAAHEFHHASQFAYTYWLDIWYGEATATWIEDEVYDGVNQLYAYLYAYYHFPGYSLNIFNRFDSTDNLNTGGGYGRWIFNRYLAERFGITMVRRMWEAIDGAGNGADINMLPYLDNQLRVNGSSLAEAFSGFAKKMYLRDWITHQNDLNRFPSLLMTNYSAYPVNAQTVPLPGGSLQPYAFAAYSFTSPGNSASNDFTLTISNRTPGIELALFRVLTSGAIQELPVVQSASALTVPGFYNGGVSKAVLLVINPTASSGSTFSFTTDGSVFATPPGGFAQAGSGSAPTEPAPTTVPSSGSGGGGGGCFIATAAYGSYMHPKVLVLREFRDRWFMTNPVGRMLVNCYYHISPPMAAVIARHEFMRRGSRILLAPLVAAVEHPESFASLVLALLGWALIRRRATA
jgi:hypothetical protein